MMEPLLTFLRYLDISPGRYHLACVAISILFAGYLFLPVLTRRARNGWVWSDAVFAVLLLLFLVSFRWPGFFYDGELNPDESYEIIAARRLLRGGAFGVQIDGGTAGPLNYYPLSFLGWMGLPLNYATVRLLGMILVAAMLIFQYHALKRFSDRDTARVAIVPVALFFAFTTHFDFVHLTTEHVSLFLLSVAAYLLSLLVTASGVVRAPLLFGIGAVTGMLPMAKIQSAILAVSVLAAAAMGLLWHARRGGYRTCAWQWISLGAGVACIPAVFLVYVAANGALMDFFRSYAAANVFYGTHLKGFSPVDLFINFLDFGAKVAGFLAFVVGGFLFIAYSAGAVVHEKRFPAWLGIALGWCFLAIVTVVLPGRQYVHYLLYAVTIFGLVIGYSYICLQRLSLEPAKNIETTRVLLAFVVLGILPQVVSRINHSNALVGSLTGTQRIDPDPEHPANPQLKRHPLIKLVAGMARPGDEMAVWGFFPGFVLQSGTELGVRYAVSDWQIINSSLREHFRSTYLDDMKRGNVVFFVDAVAPGAVRFTDPSQRHETFPQLAAFIGEQYGLYAEIKGGGIRLFVRRDRLQEVLSQPGR